MKAKGEIDEKLKKLDNQRQKDKEAYEKEMQIQTDNHTEKMEELKNKQKLKELRQTMRPWK